MVDAFCCGIMCPGREQICNFSRSVEEMQGGPENVFRREQPLSVHTGQAGNGGCHELWKLCFQASIHVKKLQRLCFCCEIIDFNSRYLN